MRFIITNKPKLVINRLITYSVMVADRSFLVVSSDTVALEKRVKEWRETCRMIAVATGNPIPPVSPIHYIEDRTGCVFRCTNQNDETTEVFFSAKRIADLGPGVVAYLEDGFWKFYHSGDFCKILRDKENDDFLAAVSRLNYDSEL